MTSGCNLSVRTFSRSSCSNVSVYVSEAFETKRWHAMVMGNSIKLPAISEWDGIHRLRLPRAVHGMADASNLTYKVGSPIKIG